jgi:hypothetical protein
MTKSTTTGSIFRTFVRTDPPTAIDSTEAEAPTLPKSHRGSKQPLAIQWEGSSKIRLQLASCQGKRCHNDGEPMRSSMDTCSEDIVRTPKKPMLKRYKGGDSPPRLQGPFDRCPNFEQQEQRLGTEGRPLIRCVTTEEDEGDDQKPRNTPRMQIYNFSLLGDERRGVDLFFESYLLNLTPAPKVEVEQCPSLKDVGPSPITRLALPRLV